MMVQLPDGVPVLSPGRHRNPRKGACFMEFASYLAGERWSDSPQCTHPLLAHLARLVNDVTTAGERSRLVPMIPSVIGLNGSHPLVGVSIAVSACAAAMPVASEARQRAMAAGLLGVEELLDAQGLRSSRIREDIRATLDFAPLAERWASRFRQQFTPDHRITAAGRSNAKLIELAVLGIAESGAPDRGDRLVGLLDRCIEDTKELLRPEPPRRAAREERAEQIRMERLPAPAR
jgi:hypothetical protein